MLEKYLNKLEEKYKDKNFDFQIFKHELDGIKVTNTIRIPVLCKTHNKRFSTTYMHARL